MNIDAKNSQQNISKLNATAHLKNLGTLYGMVRDRDLASCSPWGYKESDTQNNIGHSRVTTRVDILA